MGNAGRVRSSLQNKVLALRDWRHIHRNKRLLLQLKRFLRSFLFRGKGIRSFSCLRLSPFDDVLTKRIAVSHARPLRVFDIFAHGSADTLVKALMQYVAK